MPDERDAGALTPEAPAPPPPEAPAFPPLGAPSPPSCEPARLVAEGSEIGAASGGDCRSAPELLAVVSATVLPQLLEEIRRVLAEQHCIFKDQILGAIRTELTRQQHEADDFLRCLVERNHSRRGSANATPLCSSNRSPGPHMAASSAVTSAFPRQQTTECIKSPKTSIDSSRPEEAKVNMAEAARAVRQATLELVHEERGRGDIESGADLNPPEAPCSDASRRKRRPRSNSPIKGLRNRVRSGIVQLGTAIEGRAEGVAEDPSLDVKTLTSQLDDEILSMHSLACRDRRRLSPDRTQRVKPSQICTEEENAEQPQGSDRTCAADAADDFSKILPNVAGHQEGSRADSIGDRDSVEGSEVWTPSMRTLPRLEHLDVEVPEDWRPHHLDVQAGEDEMGHTATFANFRQTMRSFIQRFPKIEMTTLEPNQVEVLRKRRISDLMKGLTDQNMSPNSGSWELGGTPQSPLPLFILRLVGVVPFRGYCTGYAALWYQRSICVLMALACLVCVLNTVSGSFEGFVKSGCAGRCHLSLLSDLPLAFGAAMGLMALGVPMGSTALGNAYNLLACYAEREGFSQKFARHARQDLLITGLVWVAAVVERMRGSGVLEAVAAGQADGMDVLQILIFLAISGVVLCLVLCVLWTSLGLAIAIDVYCTKVNKSSDLLFAVREWNKLQALLRKTCRSIEHCFFVLQTVAFAVVIIAALEGHEQRSVMILPGILITVGILRIFVRTAKVTDKCEHVPSFINSLWFGKDLDYARQYAVQYIMHSGAGFYVYGIKLNFPMVIKLLYIVGLVAAETVRRYLSK